MTSIYCRAGKIIVDNPEILRLQQNKHTIKVHIDRSRSDGKWTMTARIAWTPPRPQTADQFDDDPDFGHSTMKKLKDVVLEDVWDALAVKERLLDLIASARSSACPYEYALAAANEDQQEGYGTSGGIGFHDAKDIPKEWIV